MLAEVDADNVGLVRHLFLLLLAPILGEEGQTIPLRRFGD